MQLFKKFLQQEFSDENLDFYLDVQSYKKVNYEKQQQMAKEIFEKYIKTNSPREVTNCMFMRVSLLNQYNVCLQLRICRSLKRSIVTFEKTILGQNVYYISPNLLKINLDATTKMMTIDNMNNPGPLTFDSAQEKIYNLMEYDSFQRFLAANH